MFTSRYGFEAPRSTRCPLSSARRGGVLHHGRDGPGELFAEEPRDEVEPEVDPGRDAAGGDDVTLVHDAPAVDDVHGRVALAQLVEA
jgi:hypothetical protein